VSDFEPLQSYDRLQRRVHSKVFWKYVEERVSQHITWYKFWTSELIKLLFICTDLCFKQAFKKLTLCRNAPRRLVVNSSHFLQQQQLTSYSWGAGVQLRSQNFIYVTRHTVLETKLDHSRVT
jgi:hypothetical protein